MRDPKLHILQHALGLDEYGRGREYRNRFVTGPRTVSFPLCEELVAAGLMDVAVAQEWVGGDNVYWVTDAGRQFVRDHSPKPPKLTRSQERYQRFLVADTGMTFGEWIAYESGRCT